LRGLPTGVDTPETGTESGRERAKEQKSKRLSVTRLGRVALAVGMAEGEKQPLRSVYKLAAILSAN